MSELLSTLSSEMVLSSSAMRVPLLILLCMLATLALLCILVTLTRPFDTNRRKALFGPLSAVILYTVTAVSVCICVMSMCIYLRAVRNTKPPVSKETPNASAGANTDNPYALRNRTAFNSSPLVDAETGKTIDSLVVTGTTEASPVVFNNKIVIGTRQNLYCLELS